MSADIRILRPGWAPSPATEENRLHGGGGSGDNGDMEARVTKLESAMISVNDRLTKIETRLEHMPTKADLSDAVHTQTKWVVGIGFTLMMVGIAAAKLF